MRTEIVGRGLAGILASAGAAHAQPTPAIPTAGADICTAVALHDVRAEEGDLLRKGSYDTAITQYDVDPRTGQADFCSHRGDCYPARVVVNGKSTPAMKLLNCAVDFSHAESGPGDPTIFYELKPIRSRIPPAQLRQYDLITRLMEMGIIDPTAEAIAGVFFAQPNGRCATLTLRARSRATSTRPRRWQASPATVIRTRRPSPTSARRPFHQGEARTRQRPRHPRRRRRSSSGQTALP